MKKLILVSLVLILSFNLMAQDSGVGIGVILGDPTGFSVKMWMNEKSAIDAALGIEFNGYVSLHADFLFHNWTFDIAQDKMLVFFGGGPAIGIGGWHYGYWDGDVWRDGPYFNLGIRAPGGVAWHFHQMPLECFVEVAPRFNIIHHYRSLFTIDGGIGARWYF